MVDFSRRSLSNREITQSLDVNFFFFCNGVSDWFVGGSDIKAFQQHEGYTSKMEKLDGARGKCPFGTNCVAKTRFFAFSLM